MNFYQSKKKLATLWFVTSLIIFIIIFLQTILGKHFGNENDVWGWFISSIMPTLSLIIGVFAHDFTKGLNKNDYEIDRYYFLLTFYISLGYLILILLLILLQPLTGKKLIDLFNSSSIFVGMFQTMVTGVMGYFFYKEKNA